MADEQLRSSLAGYPSFLDRLDPRMQPVWVTKEHFEERGYNIIRFCSQFLKINGEAGLALTRPVVEFVWGLAVWRVYPTADPQKSRLMGQAQCPLFDIFWQRRDDSEGLGVKMERQRQSGAGFWPFPRYLSKEEVKKDRGMLIMGNLVWEYIIPEVCLMPLYHVDFLVLAKKIIDANPERPLSIEMMRKIWRVLVKEVYDFVQEPERTAKLLEADTITNDKLSEVAGLVPENLSKKRERTPEEESETETVRGQRRRHRSRRKKTVKLAEPEVTEGQITSEREVGLAARPDHPTETNDQQSNLEPWPSFLSQDVLDERKRTTVLETKLRDALRAVAAANERATKAEGQSANHERDKARLDQKLKSQAGQLRAAERRVRELSKAKRHASEDVGARRALQRQSNNLNGQLKKVTHSEQSLRAERDKLGASLTKAGLDAKGKE